MRTLLMKSADDWGRAMSHSRVLSKIFLFKFLCLLRFLNHLPSPHPGRGEISKGLSKTFQTST